MLAIWELTCFNHWYSQRPTPPLAPALEEEEAEKSCGPTGFWEVLTPCNGCRNLGFSSISQVHPYAYTEPELSYPNYKT